MARLHYIGHSLVLWIIVAAAAAVRGTWLQSWLTTSAVLVVAVLSYFIAVRGFGPFEYPPLLSPALLFWIVLAGLAVGFATIGLTAVNRGRLSFLAVDVIAGLMLGDAINASVGIFYVEQDEPLSALLSIMHSPGPVLIIGSVGALCWIVIMMVHHRHRWSRSWLIVPGGLVGYVLVSVPDLLLHYP